MRESYYLPGSALHFEVSVWYVTDVVAPGAPPIGRSRRRAITAGLLLGMSLGALEATVVSTAMPTVIAQLGGLAHYSWVFAV